jgi:uncharacterized protein
MAMSAVIFPSPKVIEVFCRVHGISRLSLFGSAARVDFDSAQSDIDLLVEYESGRHPGLEHFRLGDELSEIFGRRVDLNTRAMLGSHLEKVLAEGKVLYGNA